MATPTPKMNVVLMKDGEIASDKDGNAMMLMLQLQTLWHFICGNKVMIASLGIAATSLLLLRRWFSGGRAATSSASLAIELRGKLALITGANSGIGLATAIELAGRGASVCLACRRPAEANAAVALIRRQTGCEPEAVFASSAPLDLASLSSVRAFAEDFCRRHARLDILVNNAGVMACPESATVDGFEVQWGVNHLGHFLLTRLLLGRLRLARGARIVTVSSRAHEWGSIHWDNLNLTGEYTPFKAYSQSKLANILFTRALASKLAARGDDVTAYCLHPGAVQTNLGRHQPAYFLALFRAVAWLALKQPEEGAQTSLHCALAPIVCLRSGGYYSDCQLTRPSANAESDADALRLWEISEQLVGLSSDSAYDSDGI